MLNVFQKDSEIILCGTLQPSKFVSHNFCFIQAGNYYEFQFLQSLCHLQFMIATEQQNKRFQVGKRWSYLFSMIVFRVTVRAVYNTYSSCSACNSIWLVMFQEVKETCIQELNLFNNAKIHCPQYIPRTSKVEQRLWWSSARLWSYTRQWINKCKDF